MKSYYFIILISLFLLFSGCINDSDENGDQQFSYKVSTGTYCDTLADCNNVSVSCQDHVCVMDLSNATICSRDLDCREWEYCILEVYRCAPIDDWEPPSDEDKTLYCNTTSDCPSDKFCTSGICMLKLRDLEYCDLDEQCIGGKCLLHYPSKTGENLYYKVCHEGFWNEGDPCVINEECITGWCSRTHICLSEPQCADDYCDMKETCLNCPEDCNWENCAGSEKLTLDCPEPCPLSMKNIANYAGIIESSLDELQEYTGFSESAPTKQGPVYPIRFTVSVSGAFSTVYMEYQTYDVEDNSLIRAHIYIPTSFCYSVGGKYECNQSLLSRFADDPMVGWREQHEFGHHLISLHDPSIPFMEGIVDYPPRKIAESKGAYPPEGIHMYEAFRNGCQWDKFPRNWYESDKDPKDLCGMAYQCDVVTGVMIAEGWEGKNCTKYKFNKDKNAYDYFQRTRYFPYSWDDFKDDIFWYVNDHERGKIFFYELEEFIGEEKIVQFYKELANAESGMTHEEAKALLYSIAEIEYTEQMEELWQKFEMDTSYEKQ
ncbi:hypothetical protein KAW38_04305 [Candidatus Micrarchaeota archaeon]|nr:hypothetical protein [Candidatus Micrarchaeota archaeon]